MGRLVELGLPDAASPKAPGTEWNWAAFQDAVVSRTDPNWPAVVWVDTALPPQEALWRWCATVISGRCAAVSDPQWPEEVRRLAEDMARTLPWPDPATPVLQRPFYLGFTSGSTGQPKGFRRTQHSWIESLKACVTVFGPEVQGRLMVLGALSHSLNLFAAMLGLWGGGGLLLPEHGTTPEQAFDRALAGDVQVLAGVPTTYCLWLEIARRRGGVVMPGVRTVLISGARWTRSRTEELQALFPQAKIFEFYGTSETSFISWIAAHKDTPESVVGWPFPGVQVQAGTDASHPQPIAVQSDLLFLDYVTGGDDPAAARWSDQGLCTGDLGHWDAQGRLCMVGRAQRMIVTAGRNLFPEEVEALWAQCPGLAAVSVQGVADPLRGMKVVAWVEADAQLMAEHGVDLQDPSGLAQAQALIQQWMGQWRTRAAAQIEAYKWPRAWRLVPALPRTASGKLSHETVARWDWEGKA